MVCFRDGKSQSGSKTLAALGKSCSSLHSKPPHDAETLNPKPLTLKYLDPVFNFHRLAGYIGFNELGFGTSRLGFCRVDDFDLSGVGLRVCFGFRVYFFVVSGALWDFSVNP